MPTDRLTAPSDVSDEDWVLVALYLALLREDSAQWDHDLREVFNGVRDIVKAGAPWRFMPHDLPPWAAVYRRVSGQGSMLIRSEPLASILTEALEGFAFGRFVTQVEVKRFFESHPEFPKDKARSIPSASPTS